MSETKENPKTVDSSREHGTENSSGGSEDVLGPGGNEIRNSKDAGKPIGNRIDTDNEGRVTQRSNTDV
ncbi:MAG: hypothetical protein M3R51_05460 [Candidatus Eremiobacteraeota bacterium]|nr:hypothetical protein [Candidatus Eremiobacteraeota bacterium]